MEPLIQRDTARESDRKKLLVYANILECSPPPPLTDQETCDWLLQKWRSMMREVRALAEDLLDAKG